jgi:hypothetical protein
VKEEQYGTKTVKVLLDDNRSYSLSALKTPSGVFLYAQGIFNTSVEETEGHAWYSKTNFEFILNGGKQSYVNVINQSKGVTHFNYQVERLANRKYQHTVEIFVAKELIKDWSSTQDVQINYAWKTPGENAYIISDMLDYRHFDWNTDWHSFHRLGGLEGYFVPVQANLFISANGLVSASGQGIDGVISSEEYPGTAITASNDKTSVGVVGKVADGDLYLAYTITHNDWSAYQNTPGIWWDNDNIELYVNGKQIVILFINGELVLPSYCTQGKAVTTTDSQGKLVTVVELYIQGDAPSYEVKIGANGTGLGWVGVLWDSLGTVSENGLTCN